MTVENFGKHPDALPEDNCPGKVIVAIIMGGYDNASTRSTFFQIQEKITHPQTTKRALLFIGAKVCQYGRAIAAAGRMGIHRLMSAEVHNGGKPSGALLQPAIGVRGIQTGKSRPPGMVFQPFRWGRYGHFAKLDGRS